MAILALKELTFQKKKQTSLEIVSIECKWLLEPCVGFSDSTREKVVFPAEAEEGYKGAKAVGMDFGVVKAIKQIKNTF